MTLSTKHVVSVSLGARSGDFTRTVTLAGHTVHLTREGTDGDMEQARARIAALDGHTDAIGLGGIDMYVSVAGEDMIVGDGLRLAEVATQTPVVDGSGLKNTLERRVVEQLAAQGLVTAQSKILMVSALDRFGMAEAFANIGCECVFGDLIFNIGLDYPLTTLDDIKDLARKYKKRLLTVPFHLLYPTGQSQDKQQADPRYAKYYQNADIIAGDRHLIMRHLPLSIGGKGIVTNTTRPDTLKRLTEAGAAWLVTTTPDLDGISGATNLMQAALVALMEKPLDQIHPADYNHWADLLGWRGAFQTLNAQGTPH